jgi:methionyl-tRNA formyltransferase
VRVVFFGTPEFAVPTLRALVASPHVVAGVVTHQHVTDAPVKAFARTHGLTIDQPDRLRAPDVEATLRSWQPDIGVVAAYGKIIPEPLLAVPRHGMINVHPSLLPSYRGAAPVHRAVIDGATTTGVTIMRVAAQLDAGATFARVERAIGPDETSDAVERNLSEIGASLLLTVLDDIAAGTAHEEPQDNALATYASRLTKAEGLIDWTLSAAAIHNRVRGLHPWPHAYSYLEGARVILRRTHVVDEAADTTTHNDDPPTEPGTVVAVTVDAIYVATASGGRVGIEEVQAEGRRPMRVRDFLSGRPVRVGMRFTQP